MCARRESVAVAGYYPTPDDQIPLIANLLAPGTGSGGANSYGLSILDPCAGDGAAVSQLGALVAGTDPAYYTCEMEESRYQALEDGFKNNYQDRRRALGGDAFRVRFDRMSHGVGLLYLNPPYDTDKVAGRLEEKFLARFADALADAGVLAFVVPNYALAASAETLATRFEHLSCYRFRGAAFDAYKQVVLFAYKRSTDLFESSPEVLAQVRAWAVDASGIPELPLEPVDEPYQCALTVSYSTALHVWEMGQVDVTALAGKFQPWCETTRKGLQPVARIVPDLPIAELLHRTYEVATPPRPAHIAAGIAAGLFNGRRIEADDATSGLPPLLVKGVFDREWRTIEEKHSKDGEKTGEVQVQQPKLVVTILDLDSHKYHTVGAAADSGAVLDVSKFGIGDVLNHYGGSLMSVMEQQCKILYDPRRDAGKVEIAPLARKLYDAQAHAVRGCVTLLRERQGRSPWLLGEIGSGKSVCSLATAKTVGAKCVLIVCPPHLLQSWQNEIKAAMPEATAVVLESISDVESIGEFADDDTVIAILSRETAKLGHGWASVEDGACPKCGLPLVADDFAKKRARCGQKTLLAIDDYARLAKRLALYVRPYAFGDVVRNYLRGRVDKLRARELAVGSEGEAGAKRAKKWRGLPADFVLEALSRLTADYLGWRDDGARMVGDDAKRAILWLLAAANDSELTRKFALIAQDPDDWQHFAEELPLLSGADAARAVAAELKQKGRYSHGYSSYGDTTPTERTEVRIEQMGKDSDVNIVGCKLRYVGKKATVTLDGVALGSADAAVRLLEALGKVATWGWTPACDEPLYQAIPEPRRYPLAQYIVKRHKKLFDFLILDEMHEFQNGDTAQGLAAHGLTTLKLPTVAMTGSVMNGYATSLFSNMWALAPEFRDEFDRREQSAFCDRYGYRKCYVSDRQDGEVIAFGSQSDRVERSERDVGMAPGVLPLFLFRHLLPSAVTLHKADLRIDLPELTQERVEVPAGSELHAEYKRLLKALGDQIKHDRFVEDKAGKLFGALSELPSYLDRATADVGNCAASDGGGYEIRYPESLNRELVASGKIFPAKTLLPKEKWMLDCVASELAEGRNVMVFAWYVGLLPRLQRLIQERVDSPVPVLYADKVPTGKRQAWIDREVIQKNRRVMVANPVAIQTGLNNLVWFSTEIWHENPACNPIVYRQAIGRIDRIGQKLPTRVLFASYAETLQNNMYELLIAKVAVSTATDGLDPESALRASGIVEDEYLTGLSIGKQLWAMLSGEAPKPRPKLVLSNLKPKPSTKPAPELVPVAAIVDAAPEPARPNASRVRSDLNDKEQKVLAALGTFDGAATLDEMAKEAFANRPSVDKAKSWVRNSLRKLVERGLVAQVGRGTYALAAEKAKAGA